MTWVSRRHPIHIQLQQHGTDRHGNLFFRRGHPRTGSPHEDTLILSLDLGNFSINRMMIDASSVVDLMHQSVLIQMGYQTVALHSPSRILTRFNASRTASLDEIALPITTGPTTMFVLFCVIEEPCSFNIILERSWIHAMKVIPSTYH